MDNENACSTCDVCSLSEEQCECLVCHRCYAHIDSLCEICNRCADCCNCLACPSCARRGHDPRNTMLTNSLYLCRNCGECVDHCCSCTYCDGCDCCFSPEEARMCDDCDRCDSCCSCNEHERIYVSNPLVFHSSGRQHQKENMPRRYVAMEIECSGAKNYFLNHIVRKKIDDWNWSIVIDGSLPDKGFELQTAPANGDTFCTQMDEAAEFLSHIGAETNKQCGLHVHVDARNYTYYDMRRLVLLYAAIEPALFALMPEGRRHNQFCIPCGRRLVKHLRSNMRPKESKAQLLANIYKQTGRKIKELRQSHYVDGRYSALNVHSWLYRGTIECRLHSGTVNANKLTAWGMLWSNILDVAYSRTEHDIYNAAVKTDRQSKSCLSESKNLLLEISANSTVVTDYLYSRWDKFKNLSLSDDLNLGYNPAPIY